MGAVFGVDEGMSGCLDQKELLGCRSTLLPQVKTASTDHLLVFVSFSMPDAALKALYEETQKFGGRLIIRGLIEDSFQKTLAKAQDIGIVVDIDPTLFADYVIHVVPTVVVRDGRRFDSVDGHITVRAALEKMATSGDVAPISQKLIRSV